MQASSQQRHVFLLLILTVTSILMSSTSAQLVTTVDAIPSVPALNDSVTLRNSSLAALSSLSPVSFLPSAVLERLNALLSGYVSQGTVGLIAFAVVLFCALFCLRRLVACLGLGDCHRRVYALLKSNADAEQSLSKSSPHRSDARHSQENGTRRRMKKQKLGASTSSDHNEDSRVEMEPLMRTSSTSSTSSTVSFDPLDSPSYPAPPSNPSPTLPRLRCPPQYQPLLTEEVVARLMPHLPLHLTIRPAWSLLYATSVHGHSLQTLYHRVQAAVEADEPVLLLCRDSDGWMFGCWTPVSWVQREVYYGNAECFVFRVLPAFQIWEAVEERKRRDRRERRARRDEQREVRRQMQEERDEEGEGEDEEVTRLKVASEAESMDEDEGPDTEGEGRFYMLAKSDQLALGSGRRFALWFDASFRNGSSGPCATFDSPTLSKKPNFLCYDLECWHFE